MPKRIVPVIQIDLAVRHAKMGNSNTVNVGVLLHHWQEVHSMFMHSNGCYPISRPPIKLVSSIWLDSPANQKKGQGSETEVHLIYGDSPRIALCWLCYKRSKEVQCNEAKKKIQGNVAPSTNAKMIKSARDKKNLLMTETSTGIKA